MALNGDKLADEILAIIPQDGMNASEKSALKEQWKKIAGVIVNHFVTNAELSEAKLQAGLNGVFSAGEPVPQDGGTALQTAWKAATASGAADKVVGGIK